LIGLSHRKNVNGGSLWRSRLKASNADADLQDAKLGVCFHRQEQKGRGKSHFLLKAWGFGNLVCEFGKK
jgi:hypothetical protein